MVTTPTAPMPVHTQQPFASPGVMFTSELQELEARLPQQVLNALEAISRQMEIEIFAPLLQAPGTDELQEEFTRAFQRYSGLYFSLAFLMWGEIADIASLAGIWSAVVARFKAELESRGANTIGEEATSDTLVGLATTNLVNRRLIQLAQAGDKIEDVQQLQGWSIAYWLATSCVLSYHFDRQGDLRNVRVLAYWCRYYAAQVYQCAKSLGIVKVPAVGGPVPEPSEEDQLFAEAGLEDLVERLALEDRDES